MSHIHCKSQLELIFPAIEIIFIGVQVAGLSSPYATGHTLSLPTLRAHIPTHP